MGCARYSLTLHGPVRPAALGLGMDIAIRSYELGIMNRPNRSPVRTAWQALIPNSQFSIPNSRWIAMAEFDTISKHLIHTYPHDFARFALQQDDLEVIDVIDTEQPTVEAHRTDSLIRVRIGDEEALVHHEFQTTDSTPPMPRRMAGYIGRGIEQHGLPIYSSVIYLRPGGRPHRSGVLYPRAARLPRVDAIQGDSAERTRRPTHSRRGAFGLAAVCAVDAAADRCG